MVELGLGLGLRVWIGTLLIVREPVDGGNSRSIAMSNEVLEHPTGPTTTTSSPGYRFKETARSVGASEGSERLVRLVRGLVREVRG